MAKQPISKGGTTKVRFVFLEAEGPEGDIAQLAAAIQTALGPKQTVIQQRIPAQHSQQTIEAGNADDTALELGYEDEEAEEAPVSRAVREPRVRKVTAPKVLDLDLTTEVSLASFVENHPAKNDIERNLVVAAWFKEHRSEDAITAGHVFTCYKALKWPLGIADFAWPLRALKKDQVMTSSGRGLYAINHLGIARVQKLGNE
jgi:hypothetical protein